MGSDNATTYMSGVENRMMAKGTKSASHNNSMYDEDNVGPIVDCPIVGPRELIKFLEEKHASRDQVISTYLKMERPY